MVTTELLEYDVSPDKYQYLIEKANESYKSFEGHWKLLVPATENHPIFLCQFHLEFSGTLDFFGSSKYQCREFQTVS